jgi:hypothetical protein
MSLSVFRSFSGLLFERIGIVQIIPAFTGECVAAGEVDGIIVLFVPAPEPRIILWWSFGLFAAILGPFDLGWEA